MKRTTLVLLMLAAALGGCAAPKTGGGCIDVTPGVPDAEARVSVDGREVLTGEPTLTQFYPDRARWAQRQVVASLRCADGACLATDERIADKDCVEETCWQSGEFASDYRVAEAVERLARQKGLVPGVGVVEITVAFKTTGPIKPPKPCPY